MSSDWTIPHVERAAARSRAECSQQHPGQRSGNKQLVIRLPDTYVASSGRLIHRIPYAST